MADRSSYAALLPPLSHDEFAALKEDIADRGQIVPIVVDDRGALLDGAHRKRACEELGLEPRVEIRRDLSEGEKRQLAISLNVHRRQLTRATRNELIRKLLTEDPRRADRVVARAVGASPSTVAKVRQSLEGDGRVSKVDTRTGGDGRRQVATKRRQEQSQPQGVPSTFARSPSSSPAPTATVNDRVAAACTFLRESSPKADVEADPDAWLRRLLGTRKVLDDLIGRANAARGADALSPEQVAAERDLAQRVGIELGE